MNQRKPHVPDAALKARMAICRSMLKSRIVCLGSEGYIPGRLARDLIDFLDLRAA